MSSIIWTFAVLIFNTIMGGIGVLSLWINEKNLHRISFFLMAFAAGTLLGGAFLHLIPHSVEHISIDEVSIFALIGLFAFFLFENYLHWHRCKECDIHPFSTLVLIGDAIHNIFDGIVVAITFLASVPLGLTTSIAILAHEIPQELGIFGVMVYSGHSRRDSILYPILVQSTSILGGIIGILAFNAISPFLPLLLAFTAGGFIYIALSDLVPEIHKAEGWQKLDGIIAVVLGVLFMFLMKGAH